MDQPRVRKVTAGQILSWLAGIFILVCSITTFTVGSFIAGTIAVICAILIIPFFDKLIVQHLHFEVSGGLKVLLAIVAMISISVGFSSGALRMASANKQQGTVVDSNSDTTVVATTAPDTLNGCPDITQGAAKYNIAYGTSDGGNTQLYLAAGFITDLQFSNGYELDQKPDIGNPYLYASESFICDPGSEQGQSTNKLYCRPTYMYEPSLKRKNVDQDGNVVSTDTKNIQDFIFDITGKDMNRANDLKNLELETMTCD